MADVCRRGGRLGDRGVGWCGGGSLRASRYRSRGCGACTCDGGAGLERRGGGDCARRRSREVPARERSVHGLCAGLGVRRGGEDRGALRALPRLREPRIAARRFCAGGGGGGGLHRPGVLLPIPTGDATGDVYGLPGRPCERWAGGGRRDRASGGQRHHHRAQRRRAGRRHLHALRGGSADGRCVGVRAAAVAAVGSDALAGVHAALPAARAVAVPRGATTQPHQLPLHARPQRGTGLRLGHQHPAHSRSRRPWRSSGTRSRPTKPTP